MKQITKFINRYRTGTILGLLICCISVLGQNEAGQITGKVVDTNGATIAGATVSVKSVDNGATRDVTTDNDGFYTVTSLQPGIYDVTIQSSGFAVRTQRVRVTVGSNRRLETQMSVTPITENQDVVEGSGGVTANSQNYQQSNTISQRQIQELPTRTRDPYDLIRLSGNLTPAGNDPRINTYSINGQRPSGNNLQLDGGENLNTFSGEVGQRIPLESVKEIQIITGTFRPEFGRATGGIINVATRQGSNEFHGSLFEFHRNSEFASNGFENNALGIPKGRFVGNQFGYAIGGPIAADRLFFFNSTEANIVRSRENRFALAPTAQFLAASTPATRNFFTAFPLGTPINGRVFTAGDIRNLVGPTTGAFAALPTATPAFGLVRYDVAGDIGGGAPQDTLLTIGRVDWNITDKSLLYGRYSFEDRDLYVGTSSFSPYSNFNIGSRDRNHSALVNWTNTLNSVWSYNTKVSFNRVNTIQNFGTASPRLFLTNSSFTNIGGFPVALPGNQPFNINGSNAFTGPLNYMNAFQDFTTVWRGQQIRFGASYYYTQDNRTNSGLQNSNVVLGANLPQALNNLLLGQVSSFQAAINSQGLLPGQAVTLPVTQPNFNRSLTAHDFAGYINHIWRVHPRINVNWGLRYDYFGQPRTRNGQIASNFIPGSNGDTFTQIRNGQLQAIGNSSSNRLYERDFNNLGPRVGVGIDLTGDGKTSLRGGYGISYERVSTNALYNVFRNSSNFGLVALTANTGTTTTIPLTTNNFGSLGGTTGTTTLPGFSVNAVNRNINTPYVHFWNVALEREILPSTVASVEYTGSAGRDLFTIANVNRPGSGAAFLNDTNLTTRLNPQFSAINLLANNGRSNYHAMVADVTNSTWRQIGLQFSARYRFSKSLDNISSTLGGFNGFTTNALDPFNPDFDYGISDFDQRHRFIGSFNWEVPFFGDSGSTWSNQIFGGWEVTGIINAQSGAPFSIYNCGGATTAEAPCPRLAVSGLSNGSGDNLRADTTVPNRFVFIDLAGQNTAVTPGAVFAPFAANTTSRNAFRGPNNWNLDAGLHKRFRFTESSSVQLRAELYNLFNRSGLYVQGNSVDISSTNYVPAFRSGRRQLQLAAKIIF